MEFVIGNKRYALVESDVSDGMYGYDIYEDDNADPINLGDIAYFDHEPTQKDVEEWLADFQEII